MRNLKKNTEAENNKKKSDTSWNKVAYWYDDLLESGEGTYQKDLILPNVLRLSSVRAGTTVLDVACGQGFFSREFFSLGAKVTGVDLSSNLISLARERSQSGLQFVVSSADNLSFIKDSSIDVVFCISAIQNIENVSGVFSECFRVLKKGGKLIIVMNHPAFRVPKRSSWGFDDEKFIQYRRVDEYISESRSEIVTNPSLQSSVKIPLGKIESTVSFHRPLQFYFKALAKAGFVVTRLEEWTSNKTSQPGGRASAENKARKEFPLFLALDVLKP